MIYRILAEQVVDAPQEAAYQLVADVSRYPEFLAGLEEARSEGDRIYMSTHVGPLVLNWSCTATYAPYDSITTTLCEGPFRSLQGCWSFVPSNGKTKVRLELTLEPAVGPRFIERLVVKALEMQVERSVRAFQRRMQQLSTGRPALEPSPP